MLHDTWSHLRAEEWLAAERRQAARRHGLPRTGVRAPRAEPRPVLTTLAATWGVALTAALTLGGLVTSVIVLLIALGLSR